MRHAAETMAFVAMDIKNGCGLCGGNGPMPCQTCRVMREYDNSMAILLHSPPLSPKLPGRIASISLFWLLVMTAIDLAVLGPSPWIALLRLPPAILLMGAVTTRRNLYPAGLVLAVTGQAAAVALWSDAATALLLAGGALAGAVPALLLGHSLAGRRDHRLLGDGGGAVSTDPALTQGTAIPVAILRINGEAIQARLAAIGGGIDRLIYGPDGARARPLLAELAHARTLVAQITGAAIADNPNRPQQPRPVGTVAPAQPSPSLPKHRPLSILLVDEDGVGRTLTRLLLEKMGHEVEESDDAKMALEMALMEGPELALISSRIGRNRGLALAWCIHRGGGPAVYLLRSPSEQVTETQIQRAGLRAVLDKPLTLSRLEMALEAFMATPAHDETVPTQAELNHELLTEHLNLLGPERLGHIIDSFLSNAPETLAAAAVAASDGDIQGLGRAAHKLASGALTVGAIALAAQARNIDTAAKRQDDATALAEARTLSTTWELTREALLGFRQRL